MQNTGFESDLFEGDASADALIDASGDGFEDGFEDAFGEDAFEAADGFEEDGFEGDGFEEDGFEDDAFEDAAAEGAGFEEDAFEDGFEADALDEADGFEDGFEADALDEADGFEDGFEADALDETDGFEDGFEVSDGFEEDGFEEDAFEEDAFEEDAFAGADDSGDAIEQAFAEAMDAQDEDEFIRRAWRRLRRSRLLRQVAGRAIPLAMRLLRQSAQRIGGVAGQELQGALGGVTGGGEPAPMDAFADAMADEAYSADEVDQFAPVLGSENARNSPE